MDLADLVDMMDLGDERGDICTRLRLAFAVLLVQVAPQRVRKRVVVVPVDARRLLLPVEVRQLSATALALDDDLNVSTAQITNPRKLKPIAKLLREVLAAKLRWKRKERIVACTAWEDGG